MPKNHEWMLAVLEDVRAFCEENNLARSEEAIRAAMRVTQAEAANEDAPLPRSRKN